MQVVLEMIEWFKVGVSAPDMEKKGVEKGYYLVSDFEKNVSIAQYHCGEFMCPLPATLYPKHWAYINWPED
jgi:hypothetical protein